MLHEILTKLGHNYKLVNAHLRPDQFGIKGHEGNHSGQKGIFTKNVISPTDYIVWLYDLCIFIS